MFNAPGRLTGAYRKEAMSFYDDPNGTTSQPEAEELEDYEQATARVDAHDAVVRKDFAGFLDARRREAGYR